MKVLIGLSGGVDSAVAAFLLKQKGYDVIGATMSVWDKTNTTSFLHRSGCFSPESQDNIDEAKRIAERLDIEHHVIDCTDVYKKTVMENFKTEYLSGRTPNPCIVCNSVLKFRVLPDTAKQNGIFFDKFATGHYARVTVNALTNHFDLKIAEDVKKDQTYFLYRLNQQQLSSVLFPLGDYTKEQIRQTARKIGLSVADKPDSQDFYSGHYSELLNVEDKEGVFVDKDGNVLGKHKGFWHYTVGQRKGLGISAKKPLYVLSLNAKHNEVVLAPREEVLSSYFHVEQCVWNDTPPLIKTSVFVKLRSTQPATQAVIIPTDINGFDIIFNEPQKPAAPGQSAVFYDNNRVLGGGILTLK